MHTQYHYKIIIAHFPHFFKRFLYGNEKRKLCIAENAALFPAKKLC